MKPFTSKHSLSVARLGEERLIERIRDWLGDVSPPAPHGIGDDCAVLPPSLHHQAITVDPVVYGRHFDDSVAPRAVGAKLLKRNLSDLAAMGAKPSAAVIALTIDSRVSLKWLEAFYRGLAACARTYRVPLVGGDIAQADGILAASLTLLGQSTGHRMVRRKGARRGDWIYVTGTLGGSLAGHHYRFVPRLAEGAWLAGRAEVRSMMDISDGLAKDLHALTPSGSEPLLTTLPVSRDAIRLAKASGRPPIVHALGDGEDYELVFTIAARADRAAFEKAWRKRFSTRLTCVGRFVREGTLPPDAINIGACHGYEHLR